MTNLSNPEEFKRQWEGLSDPESIRNAIDESLALELKVTDCGRWYVVEQGGIKEVGDE